MFLRVCNIDGYIEFETNRYPVPYEYVADILTLKATEHEIMIYSADLSLLVHHQRLPAGSVTKISGAAIHGSRKVRYGLEPVRDQFIAIGEHSRYFLDGHRDTSFSFLQQVQPDDVFVLEDGNGTQWKYRVSSTSVRTAEDLNLEHLPIPRLALVPAIPLMRYYPVLHNGMW